MSPQQILALLALLADLQLRVTEQAAEIDRLRQQVAAAS